MYTHVITIRTQYSRTRIVRICEIPYIPLQVVCTDCTRAARSTVSSQLLMSRHKQTETNTNINSNCCIVKESYR